MQTEFFLLLRKLSDLLPNTRSSWMLEMEGCSDVMVKVAGKHQIPHIIASFSHRPWMETRQIGLSPGLIKQENLAKTHLTLHAVWVCLDIRKPHSVENYRFFIMYKETHFPFIIIVSICGVFTIKQRPPSIPHWTSWIAPYGQLLSHVQLFVTPWTIACQATLSMEFSRQEYWSGYAVLQGIFPNQESNPGLPHCSWILYALSHQGSSNILLLHLTESSHRHFAGGKTKDYGV